MGYHYLLKRTSSPVICSTGVSKLGYVPPFYFVRRERGLHSLAIRPLEIRISKYIRSSPHRSSWGLVGAKSMLPTANIHKKHVNNSHKPSWGLSTGTVATIAALNANEVKKSFPKPSWGLGGLKSTSPSEIDHENVEKASPRKPWDKQTEESATENPNPERARRSYQSNYPRPPLELSGAKITIPAANEVVGAEKISCQLSPELSGSSSTLPPASDNMQVKNSPTQSSWGFRAERSHKTSNNPTIARESSPNGLSRQPWDKSGLIQSMPPVTKHYQDKDSIAQSPQNLKPINLSPGISSTPDILPESDQNCSTRPSWGASDTMPETRPDAVNQKVSESSIRPSWGVSGTVPETRPVAVNQKDSESTIWPSWGLSGAKSATPTSSTENGARKILAQPLRGVMGLRSTTPAPSRDQGGEKSSMQSSRGLRDVNSSVQDSSTLRTERESYQDSPSRPSRGVMGTRPTIPTSSRDQSGEKSSTQSSWGIRDKKFSVQDSISLKTERESYKNSSPRPSWGASGTVPETRPVSVNQKVSESSIRPSWGASGTVPETRPVSVNQKGTESSPRPSWGASGTVPETRPVSVNQKGTESTIRPLWGASGTVPETRPVSVNQKASESSIRPSWGASGTVPETRPVPVNQKGTESTIRPLWGLSGAKSVTPTSTTESEARKILVQPSWGMMGLRSAIPASSWDQKGEKNAERSSPRSSWGLRDTESSTETSGVHKILSDNVHNISSRQSWGPLGTKSSVSTVIKDNKVENSPPGSLWDLQDEIFSSETSRTSNIARKSPQSSFSRPSWGLSGGASTTPPAAVNEKHQKTLSLSSGTLNFKLAAGTMKELPSSQSEGVSVNLRAKTLSQDIDNNLKASSDRTVMHDNFSYDQKYPQRELQQNSQITTYSNLSSEASRSGQDIKPEFPWSQLRERVTISHPSQETSKQVEFEAKRAEREEKAKLQSYIPLSSTLKFREIKPSESTGNNSDFLSENNKLSSASDLLKNSQNLQHDVTENRREIIDSEQPRISSDPRFLSETNFNSKPQIIQLNKNQTDAVKDSIADNEIQKNTKALSENIEPIETEITEIDSTEEMASKPKKQKKKRGTENKPVYNDERSKPVGRDRDKARREAQFIRREEEKLEAEIRQEKRLERQRLKAEKKAARKAAPIPILLPQYIKIANLAVALKVRYEELAVKMKELGYENNQSDMILSSEDSALIAAEYNFEAIPDKGEGEDIKPRDAYPNPSELPPRPPVVTIMGHVDHGKTTLLDFLRKSSVAADEHGGITQHIGAFSVHMPGGKTITFLDTPGHAAFLSMRQRGANVTDIVVLVVAADDSVKPQTIEAINHARVANVPMIVAINKIDKPEIDIDKVKLDLAGNGVEIEDFGGDTQVVCVSGKTGKGMDELEGTIMALAEILDIRAESTGPAEGWILEASKKAVGKVATLLIRRGTLHPGDIVVAGTTWAKVRILRNEAGDELDQAGPGTPVEVDGWREQPLAGDEALQAEDEFKAKRAVEYRIEKNERNKLAMDMESINSARHESKQLRTLVKAARDVAIEEKKAGKGWNFKPPTQEENTGGPKPVYFIVKADVSGSVEAVLDQVKLLGTKEVEPVILRSDVGQVSEFDVEHAAAARGNVISFNTKIEPQIRRLAEASKVKIIENSIIYSLIDDVKAELSAQLPPIISYTVLGEATVEEIFIITIKRRKLEPVAGCKVSNGSIKRNSKIRVMRDGEKVFDGDLASLKINKDDVTEVGMTKYCGMSFQGWSGFKTGDLIQSYAEIRQKRYL